VTEVFHAVGPGTEAFCNVLNTRGDRRGDDRCDDRRNRHKSQFKNSKITITQCRKNFADV